ncbi:MAG: hypothetical protein J0H15_01655 [Xanthomonadales bacterium]|nr:hypothetical protein [Xanthomonadales bacterium]
MTTRIVPLALLTALALAACQSLPSPRAPGLQSTFADIARGDYDNHGQVQASRSQADVLPPPHVSVRISDSGRKDWSLWQVRYSSTPAVAVTWAMRQLRDADGSVALVPHRARAPAAGAAASFEPADWLPLDACALRVAVSGPRNQWQADAARCSAIIPGIGTEAAVLPLVVEVEGEWLRIRFNADQARGPDAREDLRRVVPFTGWAALNGSGPDAAPGSDWHMDRALQLGSEGGRTALAWRDGAASGWSLMLERPTYRDGSVPVLKLSVVEDASGRTLAYAWANPDATRIGINLGWLQAGLERASASPAPAD